MEPLAIAGYVSVVSNAVLGVILGALGGAIAWALQRDVLWVALLAAGGLSRSHSPAGLFEARGGGDHWDTPVGNDRPDCLADSALSGDSSGIPASMGDAGGTRL